MAKKEKVEFNASIHGAQLEHCIKTCSDHKAIIEGAIEAMKELRKVAQDELGVSSKDFNKLFTIYHKDRREAFENESEEIIEMYDAIFTK